MVRRGERGAWLIELAVAVILVMIVAASAAAVLRAQSREVRSLYEERVAWEAAEGELERLESAGWKELREGDRKIELKTAGLENLADPRITLRVSRGAAGAWRVVLEVGWTDAEGATRIVRARTWTGGAP